MEQLLHVVLFSTNVCQYISLCIEFQCLSQSPSLGIYFQSPLITRSQMKIQTIKTLLLVFLTCLTTVQVTVMRYSRIASTTKQKVYGMVDPQIYHLNDGNSFRRLEGGLLYLFLLYAGGICARNESITMNYANYFSVDYYPRSVLKVASYFIIVRPCILICYPEQLVVRIGI